MVYEDEKKNDQIASSTGQNGFTNSKRLFAGIFTSIFAKTFYATPVVRHSGLAAVSKNRLSRDHTNSQGFLRFAQGLGVKKHTALFYSLLCRKKAAKKRLLKSC